MQFQFQLTFDESMQSPLPKVALIWGLHLKKISTEGHMPGFLQEAISYVEQQGEAYWPGNMKTRVRNLLRYGAYKPSGRSKPASEFLYQAALKQQLGSINGPVDINNTVSLQSGCPGSIFDADLSGEQLLLKRGEAQEAYVFNPSGQIIKLHDLLCIYKKSDTGWLPCGNPVKDSMLTKINDKTKHVVAVLFAPDDTSHTQLQDWADHYQQLLKDFCLATKVGCEIIER